MSETLNSNNIKNDKSNSYDEETDYKNLIAKLQEIKKAIALLEKTIFR